MRYCCGLHRSLNKDELDYQINMKGYCPNIIIQKQMNPKLQKQHMPKRYWKFLPEKR
jgi:hypothetical protein